MSAFALQWQGPVVVTETTDGPRSLKHLLSGPSQKMFATPLFSRKSCHSEPSPGWSRLWSLKWVPLPHSSILAAQASFLRPSPPPGTPSGTWLSFMTQIRLQTPLFQAAFVDHPSGANFLHFPGHHSVIFFLEFSTTSKPLISLFTSFLSCTKARLCVSVHQCSPGQYRPGA